MFPSYRNQSVDLQSKFYMMGTLVVKRLSRAQYISKLVMVSQLIHSSKIHDHFSVSAVSIHCRYEDRKNCPFKIKDNTVTWDSKSLLVTRSVIELSRRMTISNVNVLVSYMLEITIVEYSREVTVLEVRLFPETYSNDYYALSLFICCTRSSLTHHIT